MDCYLFGCILIAMVAWMPIRIDSAKPKRSQGRTHLVFNPTMAPIALPILSKYASSNTKIQILVSYVIDEDLSDSCLSNLEYFLVRGVKESKVKYYFSAKRIRNSNGSIIESNLTYILQKAWKDYPFIRISETKDGNGVIEQHVQVIREAVNKRRYDLYFLISCDSEGPFYFTKYNESSTGWIDFFTNKLIGNTTVVSSTVSCEISPHIQSYAFVMTLGAANIALNTWKTTYIDVTQAEIDFSNALLSSGHNFASLDGRFTNQYFQLHSTTCDPYFENIGNSSLANPLICYRNQYGPLLNTPGCLGVHPCETIFVKIIDPHNSSKETINLIAYQKDYDRYRENLTYPYANGTCVFSVAPPRPNWDISKLYYNITHISLLSSSLSSSSLLSAVNGGLEVESNYTDMETWYSVNITSSLVIAIRAHGGYANQLNSLLWSLESLHGISRRITVIVIPTHVGSPQILKESIADGFLNSNKTKHIRIIVIDFPEWIYAEYGSYLSKICTSKWKYEMIASKLKYGHIVHKSCTINSPLHYLLVDIALYHILQKCNGCKRLLVTNADNLYSPDFFKTIIDRKYTNYDVIMTNFIGKGRLVPKIEATRGRIDLGAFMTKIDFLRNTGITFLNSISSHPHADDYHDADGLFVTRLVVFNASVLIVPVYLFYHV